MLFFRKRRLDLSVVSKNGKGKRDDKASCSQEWHKYTIPFEFSITLYVHICNSMLFNL